MYRALRTTSQRHVPHSGLPWGGPGYWLLCCSIHQYTRSFIETGGRAACGASSDFFLKCSSRCTNEKRFCSMPVDELLSMLERRLCFRSGLHRPFSMKHSRGAWAMQRTATLLAYYIQESGWHCLICQTAVCCHLAGPCMYMVAQSP